MRRVMSVEKISEPVINHLPLINDRPYNRADDFIIP